jgi:LPS export ABC transporter protein LptC
MTHTDSGVVSTKLSSNKMLNFSNNKFPYFEFPEKIQIVLYDKNMSETKIFSDYAISYSDTNLIDLRGNVVVSTPLKDTLFSDQLYYNSEIEWLFTDFNFRYVSENKDILGKGFNSDKEFKNVTFSDVSGYLSIQE